MKFILLALLLIGSVYTAPEACPGSVIANVCDCSTGVSNSANDTWDAVTGMCVDSCSGVNSTPGRNVANDKDICTCTSNEYIDLYSGTASCTSSQTCAGTGLDKDDGKVCVCTSGSLNMWLDTAACELTCPGDSSANHNDICACPTGQVFNPFMNSCESDCTGTTNAKANSDGDLCIPNDTNSYLGWNKWLDTPAMVTACPNETSPGDYDFCKCPTGQVFNPFMNSCESDCTGTTNAKINQVGGDLCIPDDTNSYVGWNKWLDTPAMVTACPNESSPGDYDICKCPTGEVFNPFMNSCESDCTGTTNAKANSDGDLCIPNDTNSYVGWNKWLSTPAMVTACPNEASPGNYDICECPTGEVFNPFMNSCESDCSGTSGSEADGDICVPSTSGQVWNPFLQTAAFVTTCPGATQVNDYKVCACPTAGHLFNPFNGQCAADCSATTGSQANGGSTMCVPSTNGNFWNPFADPPAFQVGCTGLTENTDYKICQCASGQAYDSLAQTPGCVAEASCSYGDGAVLGNCACTGSGESYIPQLNKCGVCPTGMTSNQYDVCGCYVVANPVYDAFANTCVANAAACDTDNANDKNVCVCATSGQGYNNWLDTPACGACPTGTVVSGLGECHCEANNTIYDPTTSSCVAQASCPASAPYSSADKYCKCSTGSWDPFLETAACAASCSGASTANYLGVCACSGDKVWDSISASADCADACPTNATANSSGICECDSGYTKSNNACSKSGSGNEQNTGSSIMHFALALLAIVALLF